MAHEGKDFQEIFEFMFSRSGDLMSDTQPSSPLSIAIHDGNSVDVLTQAITGEQRDNLISKLTAFAS